MGGAEILRTGTYSGMKFSEARQQLLAEAKKAGLKDEPVAAPGKTPEEPKEAPEATPTKTTRGSRGRGAGKGAKEADTAA